MQPSTENQRLIFSSLAEHQGGKAPEVVGHDTFFFCPCHEDGTKASRRSLSVKFEPDGKTAAHCFACGSGKAFYDQLAEAIQVPRNTFDSGQSFSTAAVPEHVYKDADGKNLLRLRRHKIDGRKVYGQDYWDGQSWVKVTKGTPIPVKPVLYNLQAVIEGVGRKETVYLVEGEKCADRLISLGLIATTSWGGAGKWKDEYGEPLTGADVVILPDNDAPGRGHAKKVSASLRGRATSVKVLDLPKLEQKQDVDDWLNLGHSVQDLSSLAKDLIPVTESDSQGEKSKWSTLLKASDLSNRPPKSWLLNGFLGVGDFAMIAGLPGTGKSFVVLDMCIALALGRTFADTYAADNGPTRVLYLASEGHAGFGQRLRAAQKKYEIKDPDEELDNFRLIEDVPNFFGDSGDDSVSEVIEGIKASGFMPELIVADTFHDSITGANENDSGDAGIVLKNIQALRQALGCAVLVVHHTGKDGVSERGSGAYRGKADMVAFVQNDKLSIDKSKDGVTNGDGLAFRLAKDIQEDLTESPSVTWSGKAFSSTATLAPFDRKVLDAVRNASEPLEASDVVQALNLEASDNNKSKCSTALKDLDKAGLLKRSLRNESKPTSKSNPYVYSLPMTARYETPNKIIISGM